jgi:hypothetical protein
MQASFASLQSPLQDTQINIYHQNYWYIFRVATSLAGKQANVSVVIK